MAQKIIFVNPCKAVALPKTAHREMQTIPSEQLQAFLQEAKATGVYKMYYIELATDLRRGELLGLKWTNIDWKNGIIKAKRQVARVNGEIVKAPLKTKNSYRVVSISPLAVEILKQQKAKTISGMLGHFSAGFTLDTYDHVTTSAQREAAQTLGSLLNM